MFLKFLSRMLREQKSRFIVVALVMAVVGISEGIIITLVVPLLNLVIPGNEPIGGFLGQAMDFLKNILGVFNIELSLGLILMTIVAIFVIQGILRILQMRLQMKMLTEYESSLIHNLFGGFLTSSWPFFFKNKIGQLINVLTTETSRATAAFQFTCQFATSFFMAIFYIALALLVSWQITLVGVIMAASATLLLRKLMKKAEQYGVATSEANNELQAYAFDKLSAVKMLKSSATEGRALDGISTIIKRKVRLRYLAVLNSAAIQSFYEPLVMAIMAFIGYLAITRWGAEIVMIIVFVLIFFRLVPHFSAMQGAYQQTLIFMPGLSEVDKLNEQINSLPEISGSKKFEILRQGIVFDNVSFSYDGKIFTLKEINIDIKKSTSVAIVGESGVGKTTLVDLLLGLLAPTKGQILVDGSPMTDYELNAWRKSIGYMSQDIFLFHDTVEANLKWTAPGVSEENIKTAIKLAYADEFLSAIPEGNQAIIGDRGLRLSVGQRQRLTLARTILQKPEIIILDEATSSLDSESEAMIQKAIKKIWAEKTVITIAHRLSTVKDVDHIYVLEDGGIVEHGTWDELVASKGRFEQMRAMQNL